MIDESDPQPDSAESSAESVREMLRLMEASGFLWALWRRQDVSFDLKSDIDLVSSTALHLVLRAVRPMLHSAGYRVVLHTHYDIGDAQAVWILTPEGSIIHLDFVADPNGLGRLSIPTETAMASTELLGDIPWVGPVWEMGYRASKYVGKGNYHGLEKLGRSVTPVGLSSALELIFGPMGEIVHRALTESETASGWAARLWLLRWARLIARLRRNGPIRVFWALVTRSWGRLRRPAGTWIHVLGEPVAPSLGPVADLLAAPPGYLQKGARGLWAIFRSSLAIFRPRLVVTYSRDHNPGWWAPVHVIEDLETIVPILETKAWQRIG